MAGELVSAVIPTYNYGRFVCEAVESALAQTYSPLEIIVVDDGSTDDTRERLRSYGDRIRYIHQHNQGLSAARNTGIREARGQWIAFLDSDDRWHPRRVEAQMRHAAADPAVALIAADQRSDPVTEWWDVPEPGNIPVRPVTLREMLVRCRFGPGGVLARRECFDAVGGFDTTLRSAEDRDMWLRIAGRFPMVKLEAPLWWYRLHAGSMSTAAVRMEENEMKVLRRALDTQESVRGDFLLRRKVISYTLKSSAIRHMMAGEPGRALNRLVRSTALWPFPYKADERIMRFERPKRVARCLLWMLGVGTPKGKAPRTSPVPG